MVAHVFPSAAEPSSIHKSHLSTRVLGPSGKLSSLEVFEDQLRGKHVIARSDNSASVWAVNKLSMTSLPLHLALLKIFRNPCCLGLDTVPYPNLGIKSCCAPVVV